MRSVRVVEGLSHYVAEDIPRPELRHGTAKIRIEASLKPFYHPNSERMRG
jgi:hypothetical protein